MSERVDGVAGRQVGAGDKVLTVGRLNLYPGPALQVAVETAHLASGEGDVGHAAFAVVPWRINTKKMKYKHKPTQITVALGQTNPAIGTHEHINTRMHTNSHSVFPTNIGTE